MCIFQHHVYLHFFCGLICPLTDLNTSSASTVTSLEDADVTFASAALPRARRASFLPARGRSAGGPARAARRRHVGGSGGGRSRVPDRSFPSRRFPALSRCFPGLSRRRGESGAAPASSAPSPVLAGGLPRCSSWRLGCGRAPGSGRGGGGSGSGAACARLAGGRR